MIIIKKISSRVKWKEKMNCGSPQLIISKSTVHSCITLTAQSSPST